MTNFTQWNRQKQEIHESEKNIFCNERDIWFCSLGINIGYEQDGKHNKFSRPILVIKKFNKSIFWGLPLTTKKKSGKYYYSFLFKNKSCCVILSQLRLMDTKRLINKKGKIGEKDFNEIKKILGKQLLPEEPEGIS